MTITHPGRCPGPLSPWPCLSVMSLLISPPLAAHTPPHQTSVPPHSSAPDTPTPAPSAGPPPPTEYPRSTVPPEPSTLYPASHPAHCFPWVPDAPSKMPHFAAISLSRDEVHPLKVSPSFHDGESSSSVAWPPCPLSLPMTQHELLALLIPHAPA